MKKNKMFNSLILFALLFFTGQIFAQYKGTEPAQLKIFELGARFMPTITVLKFNTAKGETVKGTATVNYGYGGMLAFNLSARIGLHAEVNYDRMFQKYKDLALEREVNINYLNVPVMLSVNTDKSKPVNLNFVAGPQFGINVGSDVKIDETTNGTNGALQAELAVKKGDVGLAYGAGLEFALNQMHTIRLDAGFRGMYGFVKIDASPAGINTYNILVNASRKTYAGYLGITFCL